MSVLAWHWSRWRRFGRRRAVAGAALLLYALGVCLFGIRPETGRIEAMRGELHALEARKAPVAPEEAGEAQLAAFYAGFPDGGEATEWLARIHAVGAKTGVPLEQAEYRFHPESESGLMAYEISLPLHGSYPQIRDFIATLLADIPAAALSNIRLERENAGDPVIAARLRLRLFLRKERP